MVNNKSQQADASEIPSFNKMKEQIIPMLSLRCVNTVGGLVGATREEQTVTAKLAAVTSVSRTRGRGTSL